MTDQPYRCPYCDHWRTYERLLLAQGELTQSQERVLELEKRLAVEEELLNYVCKRIKNSMIDRGDDWGLYRFPKNTQAFLAHQPGDYVTVRRDDLKFIVDALTTPETLTIYEEIVRLQAALNPQPATDDMVEKNNAH